MRTLKTLIAFAALGGGFLVLDAATRHPDWAPGGPATEAGLDLAEILASRAGLAVETVVTAPPGSGERDFRALLAEDGRLRPVFGRIRSSCAGAADAPACWEIAYLEIDGRPAGGRLAALATRPAGGAPGIETADAIAAERAAATARPDPAPEIAPLPPADAAEPRGPFAEDPPGPSLARAKDASQPVPAARPEPGMMDRDTPPPGPPDDGPDPVRKPTHAVDRPVINARSGPGTGTEVVARLPAGLKLAMIGEHDGWGRFIVLDGDDTGREIWAALAIVKPLE